MEALLLLPGRGEHRHQYVPVRQASVGDHDHLLDYWRMPGPDVDQRQPAHVASGAALSLDRGHGVDGCDELALVSLAIALIGFKQIKGSTEQPTLTEVSV